MVATVRDWQLHGVDLKVEVATSGALTVGSNSTVFPFNTGGVGGAPAGWSAFSNWPNPPGNPGNYNFTTALNVFSVSAKTVPATTENAGIQSSSFPLVPGYRYQVGCQQRRMAGKTPSNFSAAIYTSQDNGNTWQGSAFVSVGGAAAQDWSTAIGTSNLVLQAGFTLGKLVLLGSPDSFNLGLWGTQYQNVFVAQMDLTPLPIVWHDITCDVQSIGIRYGREKFTNRYDVSTLSLQLKNDDGEYSFHSDHPLNLKPGRQVRVTATYKGVTYPQAFHVIDSITDAFSLDGRAVSRWQCVDPTTVLSNANVATAPPLYSPGGGGRIGRLLDQVGYVPRFLDFGQFYMQGIVASGRTVRDEAGLTADSEGGNFFADRLGNCIYKDRTWQTSDPNLTSVQADLVAYPHEGDVMPIVDDIPTDTDAAMICVNELKSDWSLARVVNIVTLANAGGTAQAFVNADSMKAYGPQTYQRLDFVLMYDTDLPTRAADIMGNYTDPVLRFNAVSYAPGLSGSWEFTLGVFLNWLVRVWYTHPINYWGYATTVHIQSIEHRISPTDWSTTFTVDLPKSFVEIIWAMTTGWDVGLWDSATWDAVG